MIQSKIGIGVKLLAKFSHVIEPILNAGRRGSRRTLDRALDTLRELQVSHQHTVEREEVENRFPNKCSAVRLFSIDFNEEVTDVREIGENEFQTLPNIMLQSVKGKLIKSSKEPEAVCVTSNLMGSRQKLAV